MALERHRAPLAVQEHHSVPGAARVSRGRARSVPAAAFNGACLDAEEARTSTTDRWLGARKAVGWEEFDAQALLEDEACLNELELHLINLDNDSVAPLLSHARDATLSRGNLGASRV